MLPDFSLDDPAAGRRVALVGHTGAGKSSIARLIARFYEFQDGELLVDGRDIRRLDLAEYRRQIGLVPQEPFLFSGTVRDNIRYGRPERDRRRGARGGRCASASGDWLADLPDGLDTDVGERGANLSMGQRQLVALARVLLKDPAIFILDEATASVDPFTETQIQEGLETMMRDRTAIVIAHRLSTVRHADRIIVMDEGRIIEEGTHDQLLAHGGHYAELYNTYFRHQSLEYVERFQELVANMTNIWQGKLVCLRALEPEDWQAFFDWDRDTEMARSTYWIPFPGSRSRPRNGRPTRPWTAAGHTNTSG